ncbi:MAG: glycosyltransferase family 2 protein [Deltaproteobacteria bacterium]
MKISIITVVRNNKNLIAGCIESVLAQTYSNIEYIVIDGGSTDGTLDVIKRYEPRISRWVSEPDRGIYDALNKGISMATGDVIGFLHSDDFYAHAGVIGKVAEALARSLADSVYGDLVYLSADGGRVVRLWRAGEFRRDLLRWGWMPPHPTFFVRAEVYRRLGGFNTDFSIASDYELVLRLLMKYEISTRYIPEVLVKMRMGGRSNGRVRNVVKKSIEDYRALKMSGMSGALFALVFKNISKVPQFFSGRGTSL